MYCPRCGTPNEKGDRYCSSCGAGLKESPDAPGARPGEGLKRLIGTTRKARLTTLATVVALAVAVAAFFALKSDEETIPRDAYTVAADQLCLDAKRQIVVAQRGFDPTSGSDLSDLAGELVPIVAAWRSQFQELVVPADRVEKARQLEIALLGAAVKIGGLARVAPKGVERETVASAREADAASAGVEEAISSLGLSRCAAATIGFTPSSG